MQNHTRNKCYEYKRKAVSQDIILLYIPHSNTPVSHALSFDKGYSWSIGYQNKTMYSKVVGTDQEIIELCQKINKEHNHEEQ